MSIKALVPLLVFVLAACSSTRIDALDSTQAQAGGTDDVTATTTTTVPVPTSAVAAPSTTSTTVVTTTTAAPQPATTEPSPVSVFDLTEDPLVAFEADWLCRLQGQSFEDLAAMEELRLSTLAEAGLTTDQYELFRQAMESDQSLRGEVLEVFQATCS